MTQQAYVFRKENVTLGVNQCRNSRISCTCMREVHRLQKKTNWKNPDSANFSYILYTTIGHSFYYHAHSSFWRIGNYVYTESVCPRKHEKNTKTINLTVITIIVPNIITIIIVLMLLYSILINNCL